MAGLTTEQRRKNMQSIRGKDTQIETLLRKELWAKGYHFRKNYKKLPGCPDIVLTKYKVAIFCDGEFFHGKDWDLLKERLRLGKRPDYWIPKIQQNIAHDDEVNKRLRAEGWTVIRFWGEEIRKDMENCVKTIEEAIFENKLAFFEYEGVDGIKRLLD